MFKAVILVNGRDGFGGCVTIKRVVLGVEVAKRSFGFDSGGRI